MNQFSTPLNVRSYSLHDQLSRCSLFNAGDLSAVIRKFGHTLVPRGSSTLLQQWDLWGPLILVTTLAILLQSTATKSSAGVQFAEVFTLMLIGSVSVTVSCPSHHLASHSLALEIDG